MLETAKENYHCDNFSEIVSDIVEMIEKSEMSEVWVNIYENYCKEFVPCTDDFSYTDLGDLFVSRLSK